MKVHDEYATLKKLAEGFSIGRWGDGEAKLMRGADAVREPKNRKLAAELTDALQSPHERCLVGVLREHHGPKNESLTRHRLELWRYLDPSREYWSAHITRADHCPWMETAEYAELAHALWRGKRVTVLCQDTMVSTCRAVSLTAREIEHVPCPRHETYALIDYIERQIVDSKPEVVVMAAGPAATCLANRLSKRGVQALDFGRIGSLIVRNSATG